MTKDPFFAGIAARELFKQPQLKFPFSEMAVETNKAMPLVSVDRVQQLLGGTLERKRILLMGIAYRQDVADTRYSPSQTFVEEAQRRGADVLAHDPLVTRWPELAVTVMRELPPAASVDAVVFAVPHRAYRELDLGTWLSGARPVILDANAVLSARQRAAVANAGCVFGAIGKG